MKRPPLTLLTLLALASFACKTEEPAAGASGLDRRGVADTRDRHAGCNPRLAGATRCRCAAAISQSRISVDTTAIVASCFDEYQSKENAKHTQRAMQENARQGYWNGSVPPITQAYVIHVTYLVHG